MPRVPDSSQPEYAARRAASAYDLPAEYRHYVHAWTTQDDEIDETAVMVGVGGTSAEMISAGLSYIEPQASVSWCAAVTPRGVFPAGGQPGPLSVHRALGVAHRRCRILQYSRVVIMLEERGMWRAEWGVLADHEGLF